MANTNIYDMLDTWNNVSATFTAIQMNVTDTASAAGSKLLDLQLGGTSVFAVKAKTGTAALPTLTLGGDTAIGWYRNAANQWTWAAAGANQISLISSTFRMTAGMAMGWGSGDSTTAADTNLVRDAAATLAQRTGTTAQTFRLYNTFTSATNYERLSISWASNICTIKAEAQTGTVRPLQIKYTPQTVASLPVASTAGAGARMFVSDALTPVFGSAVTGGGAVNVPVYSDGTNWMVG